MTRRAKAGWCPGGTEDFPVIATALAVAGCFGEALLQRYMAPGRTVQLALPLAGAVPLGLLFRFFAVRSRKSDQQENRGDRGH